MFTSLRAPTIRRSRADESNFFQMSSVDRKAAKAVEPFQGIDLVINLCFRNYS